MGAGDVDRQVRELSSTPGLSHNVPVDHDGDKERELEADDEQGADPLPRGAPEQPQQAVGGPRRHLPRCQEPPAGIGWSVRDEHHTQAPCWLPQPEKNTAHRHQPWLTPASRPHGPARCSGPPL